MDAHSESPGLIEQLPGVAYVVSPAGKILDYSRDTWNQFARTNRTPELTKPGEIINRSLFDFIDGETVRDAYQQMHDQISSGQIRYHSFLFRCDAPEFHREMCLVLSRFDAHGESAILYQSLLLHEQMRPAMNFLLPETHKHLTTDAPIIAICSYCLNIRERPEDLWITPEQYYRQGGSERVRLSHGICDACMETIVQPMLGSFSTLP